MKTKLIFPGIFKLTHSNDDPMGIDYDIYGLHKRRVIVYGELILTEYYKNYEDGIYSDLVVSEQRKYTRDSIALAVSREQITTWYFEDEPDPEAVAVGEVLGGVEQILTVGVDVNGPIEDPARTETIVIGVGTPGCTKTTFKYYTPTESRNEGIARRQNALDIATMYVLSQVGLEGGLMIQDGLASAIQSFIMGNPQPIKDQVNGTPYLDSTQKATIIYLLTLS